MSHSVKVRAHSLEIKQVLPNGREVRVRLRSLDGRTHALEQSTIEAVRAALATGDDPCHLVGPDFRCEIQIR
jgi:hypothetical protein